MTPEDASYFRNQIVEQLDTLSSLEEQIHYQDSVPIAQVPSELVCQWFGETFDPSDSRLVESFTPTEISALCSFNSFFEDRLNLLPDTYDVLKLHQCPSWLDIVAKAGETLLQFGPGRFQ